MLEFPIVANLRLDQLLRWSDRFRYVSILNSNSDLQLFTDRYHQFDLLIAVGENRLTLTNVFSELKEKWNEHPQWLFGYFGYDLKNQLENLQSNNADEVQLDGSFFFSPTFIFKKTSEGFSILGCSNPEEANAIVQEIQNTTWEDSSFPPPTLSEKVDRSTYLKNVSNLQQHIHRGDIYEVNYCIEFFAKNCTINPATLYDKLNNLSPMPFSAFIKNDSQFTICASPERFLAKRGEKIISQPIKGTARRGKSEREDEEIKKHLFENEKERSENVMIVDLVRNDLSRTAKKGSVEVEELFEIKTFRQLHQMISTVVSAKSDDVHFLDVLSTSFPMGSMTGAPKISAMQLIEEMEKSKRGVYSGAIGYITPSGDFDFNVVIRSLLYNAGQKVLSFSVGSAITAKADAENEYEECLLKAQAMMQVLSS